MTIEYKIHKMTGFFGRVYGYKVLTYASYSENADPILISTRTFESEGGAQAYIEEMQKQGNNNISLF